MDAKPAGGTELVRARSRPYQRPDMSRVGSVSEALGECRLLFIFAVVFGVAVNLLLLTGPIYVIQIYDRVLTSSSAQTLMALTILVVIAYLVVGLVDGARAHVISKVSLRIERLLGERLVTGAWSRPGGAPDPRGAELLRDLDVYRSFYGGRSILTVMDLPFVPLFVAVIFVLNPWLGVFSLAAMLIMAVIVFAMQLFTRSAMDVVERTSYSNSRRIMDVAAASESVRVMGMEPPLLDLWRDERDELVGKQATSNERMASFHSAIKAMRFAAQALVLGLGAVLVMNHDMSAGGMIAASLILGRALAPIEQAFGAWRHYHAAQAAGRSIDVALRSFPNPARSQQSFLPRIKGEIVLERLTHYLPKAQHPLITSLSAKIPAGTSVGILGPSGVGKSSLARILVGAQEPSFGCIRYDGADIRFFDPAQLGEQIGYLSQEVPVLNGTVKDNIARFHRGRDHDVIKAAKRARVHDMILCLPDGYDTVLGEGGLSLSPGQRQRIGLARAFFGNPRVVVLDEPNANLDREGETALQDALGTLVRDNVTVLVVTHRMNIVSQFDALMLLAPGKPAIFGARQAVLDHLAGKEYEERMNGVQPALPFLPEAMTEAIH